MSRSAVLLLALLLTTAFRSSAKEIAPENLPQAVRDTAEKTVPGIVLRLAEEFRAAEIVKDVVFVRLAGSVLTHAEPYEVTQPLECHRYESRIDNGPPIKSAEGVDVHSPWRCHG